MINESLLEAFQLIWDMYDEAIEKIPDKEWKKGNIRYLTPARIIYHAVETGEYYSGNTREFQWGHRFNLGYWEATEEKLPDRTQIKKYHNEVKVKITNWLNALSDEELMAEETIFKWTGKTVHGRALYLLSHYRQHFGELNAELRHRDLPRIEWKTH